VVFGFVWWISIGLPVLRRLGFFGEARALFFSQTAGRTVRTRPGRKVIPPIPLFPLVTFHTNLAKRA
jgi:hypothetical protein